MMSLHSFPASDWHYSRMQDARGGSPSHPLAARVDAVMQLTVDNGRTLQALVEVDEGDLGSSQPVFLILLKHQTVAVKMDVARHH